MVAAVLVVVVGLTVLALAVALRPAPPPRTGGSAAALPGTLPPQEAEELRRTVQVLASALDRVASHDDAFTVLPTTLRRDVDRALDRWFGREGE